MSPKKSTIDPKEVDESLAGASEEEHTVDDDVEFPEEKGLSVRDLYAGFENTGTEEVSQEDLNTPYIILMQSGTKIDNRKPGWYYRSDTKEMFPSIDVNFVYVTTKTKFNEKKNVNEFFKEYWGFFKGTNEPFKMKFKGWGLSAHRELQTLVSLYKKKYGIPMFALTVKLSSEHKEGIAKSGDEYSIDKIVCEVLKDPKDPNGVLPLTEKDTNKIAFLVEAADRFRKVAVVAAADPEDAPEN